MLRTLFKLLFRLTLIVAGFLVLYLIAAFSLPYITVNNSAKDAEDGIKIMVLSNGVHTDIVVPARTEYKDWTLHFPKDTFDVKDSRHTYIGFGWGDKGFYLYTPEWSDLKTSTAIKATCGLGGTAMHVRYLKERTKESEKCEIFKISPENYKKLIAFIEASFQTNEKGFLKIAHPGYGDLDRFYEAKGAYSLFRTCNSWTNEGLKIAGIKTACWCPSAGALMRSIRH